ncbi:hypothetical protein [Geobacter sp.]|uniref:hypothetical protein n=1 Tax=Geobacter sp. TaxID=46610 RepID=UPI00261B3F1E|nr:hypothetical protein [Geobacter sp.]
MPNETRPIRFRDFLPEAFRTEVAAGTSFLGTFLAAYESLFEELQGEVEGTSDRTSGGIPDLFDPATTPPPQYGHLPEEAFAYLEYLAGWIGIPLRSEKPLAWNREFFAAAAQLVRERSTLSGLERLLRAWLRGDLAESDPPAIIITDLTRTQTDTDAVFQLAPALGADAKSGELYAQVGLTTSLGEGAPFFFIADLTVDPEVPEFRTPAGMDTFQRAARYLLDLEKPAYTYYELRVRGHAVQLAEEGETDVDGRPAARLGETMLLWDEPWICDSDC